MSQQQLQPTRSSTVESTNSSISNTSLNSRGHDPRKQSLQRYNQLVIEQLQQQQQHHHYQTPNFAPSPSAASNIIYSSQQSLGQQQQQSSSVSPNNNNNNSLKKYNNQSAKPSPLSPARLVPESLSGSTAANAQTQQATALQHILNRPVEMNWHQLPVNGKLKLKRLRSHSATLIEGSSKLFVFGGCGDRECYSDLCVLDLDTMHWSRCWVGGDVPPSARRSHSATAVGPYIYVFGGGDGQVYTNDLYLFDTRTRLWLRLINSGDIPSARRAQSACFSESHGGIFVFGGGDGKTALNDLYFLRLQPRGSPSDTASYITPVWERWETGGEIPHGRGFHSMHLVNNRLLLVGGGDGSEYFPGIYTLDLGTRQWKILDPKISGGPKVLGHSSLLIGSFLFIIGGDDGTQYNSDVWQLNLESPAWEKCQVTGVNKMPPRAYHTAVWYDSRLLVLGGYNGDQAFADLWTIHLAGRALIEHLPEFRWPSEQGMDLSVTAASTSPNSINTPNNNSSSNNNNNKKLIAATLWSSTPSPTVSSVEKQAWLSSDPMIQHLLSLTSTVSSASALQQQLNSQVLSSATSLHSLATAHGKKQNTVTAMTTAATGSSTKKSSTNNREGLPKRISDNPNNLLYLSSDTSDFQLAALVSERLMAEQNQSNHHPHSRSYSE